jgi:hypothetical protein
VYGNIFTGNFMIPKEACVSGVADAYTFNDAMDRLDAIFSGTDPLGSTGQHGELYVDQNYAGAFNDGSVGRPFTTINAAVAVASPGTVIKVSPAAAPYIENVALPNGVYLEGYGGNGGYVQIQGTVSTGTIDVGLRYLNFGLSAPGDTLTINAGCDIRDCYSSIPVVCASASSPILAINLVCAPASGSTPLTVSGAGGFRGHLCSFISQGNVPAVSHSNGWLLLSASQLSGSRAAGYILDSSGGYATAVNTTILNTGGGPAANLNNGALASPNAIADVIAAGNIDTGTAATIVGGITFASGTLTSTAPLNANLLFNGSYLPVVAGNWAGNPTGLQNAVERIASALSGHLGIPIP